MSEALRTIHSPRTTHGDFSERDIAESDLTPTLAASMGPANASGVKLAIVEAGGDDGHAPARRAYEKAGYTGLPIVRRFKNL